MRNNLSLRMILAVVLCLVILCLLPACANHTQTDETAGNTQSETETNAETDNESPKIVFSSPEGTGYTVIRSDTSSQFITTASTTLRKALNAAAGNNDIGITTDWDGPDAQVAEDALEIVVGNTNRLTLSDTGLSLEKDQFVLFVKGSRLFILSPTDPGVCAGVDYLIAELLGYNEEAGTYSETGLSLPSDYRYTGEYEPNPDLVLLQPEVYLKSPYDANDTTRLVVCLQGLLNARASETNTYFYLLNDSTDTFWLNYLSEKGKMFNNSSRTTVSNFTEFWKLVKDYATQYGMVLWDTDVPATANVASTICSVNHYLPVKYDTAEKSLYNFLKSEGVEVKQNLVGLFEGAAPGSIIADTNLASSGSSKCDAYLWAMDKYLDQTNDRMIAYVLDGASSVPTNVIYQTYGNPGPDMNQLFNHDYLIMNRCFFFDLSVVGDEKPCDDPDQPMGTDLKTAKAILQRTYERSGGEIVECLGFPMWWMKYTQFHNNGKTEPVTLEWMFAELITTYNCAMEADAASPAYLTNASVYSQYKLAKTTYENNHQMQNPDKKFDSKTKYFTIYIGDYDSSAWLKYHIPKVWNDKARGTVPLMWGFNPNLSNRVPMVFDYIYETMTDMDYIVTGDSGAGYANPSAILKENMREGRKSGENEWIEYNMPFNQRFDLDICGFLLNGSNTITTDVRDMYNEMFPAGSFTNGGGVTVYKGVPYIGMNLDVYSYTEYKDMYTAFRNSGTNFCVYRTICWTATDLKALIENYTEFLNGKNDGYTYEYVDPYTMFELIHQSGQGRIIN
ncbi:MAG: hypothetical protein IJU20_02360 [Clostridia bacterium]|nr:hypothetical protein [Clostridia bacterium]